jgi:hypothetical protein
MIVSQTAVNKS